MRNIEEKILDKINGNITGIWQLSQRDRVQVDEVSKKYYLWTNLVYFVKNNKEHFSFCGWSSATTKSRLHALVRSGYFFQKNWEIYFVITNKTYLIDSEKTYAVDNNSLYLVKYIGLEKHYEQVKEI